MVGTEIKKGSDGIQNSSKTVTPTKGIKQSESKKAKDFTV